MFRVKITLPNRLSTTLKLLWKKEYRESCYRYRLYHFGDFSLGKRVRSRAKYAIVNNDLREAGEW